MKKVAICLKGAVGKKGGNHERFYNKNDLYKKGDYVDYVSVRDSIIKHIVDPNKDEFDFDFFLHSWNVDLKDEMVGIYTPQKFLFEDNNIYNDKIGSVITKPTDFGGVSGSLSMKKSLELKESHEIDHSFKYDMVIVYRYDVLLWKNIILNNYNVNNNIYVNAWDGSCNADYHFIMSNDNAFNFKYLFDSVYNHKNQHKFHHWIKNYIVNIMKCHLVEDEIRVGLHQEHLRVLYNKKK